MNKRPVLRFAGYQDEWKQRKLLDHVQKIVDFRGRTPKKLGMEWSDGGYLALSALNVKDGYIDFSQDVHYGDQALYDKWMSGNDLHQGQVLFTTEAPMGNVAQVPDDKKYILSQRTIAFEVNKDLVTENFFAVALRSPGVFQTLNALSSGGTAKGVSQKSLASVDITIPQDLNEQHNLAELFLLIDKLIALHQRKYDKLLTYKKAMLEKMVPKDGTDVPEVRFAGFANPWTKCKLSQLLFLSEDRNDGTYTRNDVLAASLGTELAKKHIYFGLRATDESVKSYKVVKPRDVIYTKSPIKGFPNGIIRTSKGAEGIVPTLYCVYHSIDTVNPSIIQSYFESRERLDKYLMPLVNIGARNNVNITDTEFLEGLICIPHDVQEQTMIVEFLERLSRLITFHQLKLDKLTSIKKALLDKMFV